MDRQLNKRSGLKVTNSGVLFKIPTFFSGLGHSNTSWDRAINETKAIWPVEFILMLFEKREKKGAH